MVETVIFLLGSLGFILLSRQALARPYSHGFPRFFAFEALLGMVVRNARNWLVKPYSLPQIISWILLLLAAYLVMHGFWCLHKYGASKHAAQEADRLGPEKTTRMVTEGPYRMIRHPLYASLLYLAWGLFLKRIDLIAFLLAFIASLTIFLTAVYEERENLYYFGDEYASYMRRTKRFIPSVF
jgi:protein-S-isoprenylcysteine O-methyltransferase Ste14